MRVPADSLALQHIEDTWQEFKKEPHHLRLGLAMDGKNPFCLQSTSWSTWLVIVVNYNFPPWLTIKKGHLLLALLVLGRHKVKNMDIYLAPLIKELQILWDGIPINNMSQRGSGKYINTREIFVWNMHDFLGFGECNGLTTGGHNDCPICGPILNARYSYSLSKMVFQGHK